VLPSDKYGLDLCWCNEILAWGNSCGIKRWRWW